MKQLDGLGGQAVVAGEHMRDQGFEAGVAHIHQLLVVGAIHVGFVGTHLQHPLHHGDDRGEALIVAIKGAAELERIAGFGDGDTLDDQCFVCGRDTDFDVAPRLPP